MIYSSKLELLWKDSFESVGFMRVFVRYFENDLAD